MELRQLKYFVAAADSLNFSRAAESLYISQPTLSQQIAELENELGVSLFVRTKRSVLLTVEGGMLLEKAKDLLHRSEQVVNSLREISADELSGGEVCIGYEPSLLDGSVVFSALSNATMCLRERYPAMRIFFRKVPLDDQEKALKRGEVDLLITTQDHCDFDSAFNSMTIETDRFELVYCSRQPAENTLESVLDVINSRKVFFQERELRGMMHAMKIFSEMNIQPQIQFMESIETTKLLIASGDGCLVVPHSFRNSFNYEWAHYLELDVPCNCLYTSLVWSKNNINPAIQLVADALTEAIDAAKGNN